MYYCKKCGHKTSKKRVKNTGLCSKCLPYKKKHIPIALKDAVWRKYNGDALDGKCYVCNRIISMNFCDYGHIIAEAIGGKTDINNLRPVCKKCNTSMSTENMNDFVNRIRPTNSILENIKNIYYGITYLYSYLTGIREAIQSAPEIFNNTKK